MSKVSRYLMLFSIVPLLASMAVSCASVGPAPTGVVEVHVTDPGHNNNISNINVTVSAVEIHKAGDDGEEGEWIPLGIANPTFDLKELQKEDLEEILAQEEVTAGKYTQICMTIEKVEVTLEEGETQETILPSGKLKFVRPFDVVDGGTTILTLDFDADKSVTVNPAGKVIVRPVVTLAITPASALSVEITSPEDGDEFTESPIMVNGTVSVSGATVTVNGQEAIVEDGTFSVEVELSEGENTIMAIATLGEQEASDNITVTYSLGA